MDYQVVLTALARSDLRAISTSIAQDSPVAAERFVNRLLDNAESLGDAPRRGKSVTDRDGVRRVVHRPYVIYYRVEENERVVRVLRFWHGARAPESLRLGK